jgi:radical SAM-linked protein
VKLRLRYAKLGKVRFTSHRDTARVWERALRKAELPVAVSAGFTPRPKLSFGLALSTGAESTAEYLDVELARAMTEDEFAALPARLTAALPDGFTVLAAVAREAGASSLQETVTSVTWELAAPPGTDVAAVAARLLAATELPLERERKGHRGRDDVRPQLLAVAPAGEGMLRADVATIGRGLRPAELAALAFPEADPPGIRARRTHQWIDGDGCRREVIALDDNVRVASVAGAAAAVPAWGAGA